MAKATKNQVNRAQRTRFIEAASAAECSKDEAVVDATLRKIGSYKPGEVMAKETKTADELLELLHKRTRGLQRGSEPNPQWVRIVPVSDDKRANWKVAHGPKMEPPGDYWKGIERAMPELQKLYDLLPEKP